MRKKIFFTLGVYLTTLFSPVFAANNEIKHENWENNLITQQNSSPNLQQNSNPNLQQNSNPNLQQNSSPNFNFQQKLDVFKGKVIAKLNNIATRLDGNVKINKIDNFKTFKNENKKVNSNRMSLNIVEPNMLDSMNNDTKKQFFKKLKEKTNSWLYAWRNLLVTDWNWNIIWFITVDNNFILYPAMLIWNWWTQKISKANIMLKSIINESKIKDEFKDKTIVSTWWKETKVLKLNKIAYNRLKKTFLSNVSNIWDKIKSKKFIFNIDWKTLPIKIYWIYNINNWELVYVKNWSNVITNKYSDETLKNTTTQNQNQNQQPQQWNWWNQVIWNFNDKNFRTCLEW